MPELRWILTAIGVALIIGVYIWSRRDRSGDHGDDERREPGLGRQGGSWSNQPVDDEALPEIKLGVDPLAEAIDADSDTADIEPPELPREGDQLIVALRLRARQPEGFDGTGLIKAFSSEGLEFGKFGAFHALDERRRSRFLVASLVEPGSFEIEKMHELRCPGVSMFMVLPGPPEPLAALDAMFVCARRLAERLDADVLDDKGNALTMQQAGWLREQVVEYHRRSKLSASSGVGGAGDFS
ncbi:MAG: cell division protein ZipA C-terminal FtsZ-binding domain-containing protein [Gammaproteobacteria bacterium]